MATIVIVTESDYRAILQWDDDGGASRDIIYQIVPDRTLEDTVAITEERAKKAGTKGSHTKNSAELEPSLTAKGSN